MVSRRNVLKVLGGGVIVAAATPPILSATLKPREALAPWAEAGGYTEPRRRALSYAILAPNPHNRQPWEVDLSQPDTVVVWRDKSRDLPETDPYDRQLTIGMGCFLELMAIAASQAGHKVDFDLFPNGEDGPVAVARFSDGASTDPLFAHVMDRRSSKEPFEDKQMAAKAVGALGGLANVVTDPEMVSELRELTLDAWMVEATTYRTMKESADLFRLGKAEVNANPDGIDFHGTFYEAGILFGMITREGSLDPASDEFAMVKEIYTEMLMATPAYAVITTDGNSREDQIAAGRRWLRLNLTTTREGLALHPVSQALQEFPEMAPHYIRAHEMLAGPGQTVQMLGRLGHGPDVDISPRWALETRIRNA